MLAMQLTPAAAETLFVLWMAVLGGSFGSFLNVVVYRIPAGISLVKPGSHCPACRHPIRPRDNIPVLGWLLLRGRCRDCGAWISARYPAVEALAASLFVALGAFYCLTDASPLPLRPVATPDGRQLVVPGLGEMAALCVFHLLLLLTLLAAALTEWDGKKVPSKLFLPALIVALAAPLGWPLLRPVPGLDSVIGPGSGWLDGILGLAMGAALGLVAWRVMPGQKSHAANLLAPAAVGLFLGWQAAAVLGAISLVAHGTTILLRRKVPPLNRVPYTAWLAMATLGWLFLWQRLIASWPVLA